MATRIEYRRLLTSLHHRRFRDAFLITVAYCYALAVIINSNSSWLWFWFPLGPAGIRTLFFLLSSTCVLTLRVANIRPDRRNSTTPYKALKRALKDLNTLQILGYYTASAWIFEWIFAWCSNRDEIYSFIRSPDPYSRPYLNERRVYLSFASTALAVVQTCRHLYYDYDAVDDAGHDSAARLDVFSLNRANSWASVILDIRSHALRLLHRLSYPIAGVTLSFPLLYSIFCSALLYRIYFSFFGTLYSLYDPYLYSDDYDSAYQTSFFSYSYLWTDALWLASMLLVFWDLISLSFNASFSRPPLRAGQLLTSTSPDPLRLLLNGLLSAQPMSSYSASVELRSIAVHDQIRRQAIYSDLDRQPQPAWTVISAHCLSTISSLEIRLGSQSPSGPSQSVDTPQQPQPQIHTLPKISVAPKSDVDPFSTAKPAQNNARQAIEDFARRHGNSPDRATPAKAGARLKQAMISSGWDPRKMLEQAETGAKKKLSQGIKLPSNTDERTVAAIEQAQAWVRSTSQTFIDGDAVKLASAVVYGDVGNAAETINCIYALADLVVRSVQEDQYGVVARDVGTIIAKYSDCLAALLAFVASVESRYSYATGQLGTECSAVQRVKSALSGRLGEMLNAFGSITGLPGLSSAQVRKAKELVEKSR